LFVFRRDENVLSLSLSLSLSVILSLAPPLRVSRCICQCVSDLYVALIFCFICSILLCLSFALSPRRSLFRFIRRRVSIGDIALIFVNSNETFILRNRNAILLHVRQPLLFARAGGLSQFGKSWASPSVMILSPLFRYRTFLDLNSYVIGAVAPQFFVARCCLKKNYSGISKTCAECHCQRLAPKISAIRVCAHGR